MYKHILLPVDNSELSARAETECFTFAKSTGSKVTALHVVPHHGIAIDEAMTSDTFRRLQEENDEAERKSAQNMLARLQQRARTDGIECDTVAAPGDEPFKEIVEHAQRLGCDLIVMASQRRGGLEGLLRGSETARVITHCRLAVLVV